MGGDIIQITGNMYREQKLFRTDLFLNMDHVIDLDIAPTDGIGFHISGFDARGCLATRSLGSAGWDNKNVRLVFSIDFPDMCWRLYKKGDILGGGKVIVL